MPVTALAPRRRPGLIHTAAILLGAAIFALDLAQPAGAGIAMLYVLVIVLGLWTPWLPFPIVAALGATTLNIIDLLLAPNFVFVNRPLMIVMYIATATLVTRFKRLERRALIDVQQLADLKRALDAAAIVATTDVSGTITYANDKFCEISGYRRDELLGQDHRLINSGLHSEAFIRELWRTIANGRVWHGEIRNRAKDGRLYWVDTTIVPFLDHRGKPYQYTAIRYDISARKAAEERLAQQASLARVGQLAAMVAHEVKNPLAGVKGAIQVLMSRRPPGDGELPVMRDIIDRVDALNELIGDLILFARPKPPRLAAAGLRSVLTEAADLLRRDPLGERVEIEVAEQDVVVPCDAELLRASVFNLLINAAQAIKGRGRVTLTARRDGDAAVVEVRDNGPGIPEALRDQVFEPFFTTKARGGGLGLSIARRTAELHGGQLDATFPDEGGTVMTMSLPIRADGGVVDPTPESTRA